MPCQLIMCSIPVDDNDIDAAKTFYSALVGMDMARTPVPQPAYHIWAANAIKLKVHTPWYPAEKTILYYMTDDLKKTLADLQKVGGKVVNRPQDMEMPDEVVELTQEHYAEVSGTPRNDIGSVPATWAMVEDPGGNHLAILELPGWAAKEYNGGQLTAFHYKEQTSSVAKGAQYALATEGRTARAGG